MSRIVKSLAALRRLTVNEAGTSILELALCSPILVTFLLGIVDVAMYAAARMQVGQAVYRGMEIVQVNSSAPDTDTIKAEVAASAGNGVVADDVTVTWGLYCDGVEQDSDVTACAGAEDPGGAEEIARYVTVSAAAEYTPFLGSMTQLFFSNAQPDGTVLFTVGASVRRQ